MERGRGMIHNIKLQKEFADAVLSGDKNFEVRFNDKGYQKGDCVQFTVMDGYFKDSHPLNDSIFEITYVLNGWGIKEDYVVFGIREIKNVDDK